MKSIVSIFLVMFSLGAMAQEVKEMETLFGNERSLGVFFGVGVKMTEINNQPAIFTGGEFNFVFGRAMNLGVVGYGLSKTSFDGDASIVGDGTYLSMGYGGLNIEPVFFSRKLVHFTVPVLVGVGGVSQKTGGFVAWEPGEEPQPYEPRVSDSFLIVEPGLNAELNIFKFMRLTAGASYRMISDIQIPGMEQTTLQGLSGHIGLRIGWF
ncbi:MAG: hypothetical protein ACI9RU_000560 [Litorivivens sp.]|jgi:hypothetical protein